MITPGNRVLMADRTLKAVESLVVGDSVLDWKGQPQVVEGVLTNILNDPARVFVRIDDQLTLSNDHTLFGMDNNFHAAGDARYYWGLRLGYVGANYQIMSDYNWGYNPDAVLPLEVGTVLAAEGNTSRTVASVTPVTVPLQTVLWSHRVSGSGTYVVEGLCVAAWPNTMWDWVNWQPRPSTDTLTVIRLLDTGKIELHYNFDPSTDTRPYGIWSNQNIRFVSPSTTGPTGATGPASPTGSTGGLNIVA